MFKKMIGISLSLITAFLLAGCMQPSLTDERILSDFDTDGYTSAPLTSSVWGSNDGYDVVSKTVTSTEKMEISGNSYQTAFIEVELNNDSFGIITTFQLDYALIDDNWSLEDTLELSRDIFPINGISDDFLIEKVPTLFTSIDENPPKNLNGDKQYLVDLYNQNTDFSVVENNISSSGGTAKIAISSDSGIASYSGILTVDFSWSGTDWIISSCSVDDNTYAADYSKLIGEHTFGFVKPSGGSFSDSHKCYAGNNTPLTINVKSVDNQAMTMIVDASFIFHNHKKGTNASEATEGDTLIQVSDALIPIKIGDKYHAYTVDIADSSTGCKLNFTIGNGGSWIVDVGLNLYDTYELSL